MSFYIVYIITMTVALAGNALLICIVRKKPGTRKLKSSLWLLTWWRWLICRLQCFRCLSDTYLLIPPNTDTPRVIFYFSEFVSKFCFHFLSRCDGIWWILCFCVPLLFKVAFGSRSLRSLRRLSESHRWPWCQSCQLPSKTWMVSASLLILLYLLWPYGFILVIDYLLPLAILSPSSTS